LSQALLTEQFVWNAITGESNTKPARISARFQPPLATMPKADALDTSDPALPPSFTLLEIPFFNILSSEPSARPFSQLGRHLADQRVGTFPFEKCPTRDNVHAALASSKHDIGPSHIGQESESF
jgi:hypothetical protein